jgi:hypothetical protein
VDPDLTAKTVFRDGEYTTVRGFTPCLRRWRERLGFLRKALLILSKISRRAPVAWGKLSPGSFGTHHNPTILQEISDQRENK